MTIEWLRHVAKHADLLMSVCTGAFILARTGLLDFPAREYRPFEPPCCARRRNQA